MKKTMRFIGQVVTSCAIGSAGAYACIRFELGYWAAPIAAFIGCALLCAFAVGMFSDDEETTKYDTIKHKEGLPYNEAA